MLHLSTTTPRANANETCIITIVRGIRNQQKPTIPFELAFSFASLKPTIPFELAFSFASLKPTIPFELAFSFGSSSLQ